MQRTCRAPRPGRGLPARAQPHAVGDEPARIGYRGLLRRADATKLVEERSARVCQRLPVRGSLAVIEGDDKRALDDVRLVPGKEDVAREWNDGHISRIRCRHHAAACHELRDAALGSGSVRRRNSASSRATIPPSPPRAAGGSRRSASSRVSRASNGSQQGQSCQGRYRCRPGLRRKLSYWCRASATTPCPR